MFFTLFSIIALVLNTTETPPDSSSPTIHTSVVLGIAFFLVNAGVWLVAICKRRELPYAQLADAFADPHGDEDGAEFAAIASNDRSVREELLRRVIRKYQPR